MNWIQTNWETIVSAVSAVSGAVVAVVALVKTHQVKKTCRKLIQEAEARCTMVQCPKCHKKSPLSEVSFYLPDGRLDQNLDGIADCEQ